MRFYNSGERREKADARKKRAIELVNPITPCDDRMKETAAEVAEEIDAGLDQD